VNTKPTLASQLRGVTRLALEATRNVTDIVEEMHVTIGGGPLTLGKPLEAPTKLVTTPTYGAIRGVTSVVERSLDLALGTLEPMLDLSGAEGGPLLAALNGVLGDYLADTQNPLAIEMHLRSQGSALALTPSALAQTFPSGARILVMVHGSCLDEASFRRKGHDHGAALAGKLGLVPLYLRYNTGKHISQNGRALCAQLDQLVSAWPRRVEEIVLLGHSMGGLVSRSACAVAEAEDLPWRQKLRALVTLGTPHHGAPLERGGNWVDTLLGINRYSAPLARLGKLRSAGVTDLRYGNVLDADWHGHDRFAKNGDTRVALPLPQDVVCCAVAASTATSPARRLPGDGLVPVDSALGRHADPARTLQFAAERQWVALGTTHLGLLNSPEVYAKLEGWVSAACEQQEP
jgi:pimeloyl-ACP methyl ester carboxylesterase